MCKCLGSMDGVALLSELNPRGSMGSALDQAHDWFGLLTPADVKRLTGKTLPSFIDQIELVHARALYKKKTLVIRDWTHLDFHAVPFVDAPTGKLSIVEALSERFEVLNFATVRHPLDQWLSLRRLGVVDGKLSEEDFLRGCREFAVEAVRIGFVRYEDFVRAPGVVMRTLCEGLDVSFDAGFEGKWFSYATITGDTGDAGRGEREIEEMPRREVEEGLLERFELNEDFVEAVGLLGY